MLIPHGLRFASLLQSPVGVRNTFRSASVSFEVLMNHFDSVFFAASFIAGRVVKQAVL